jgi:hypothetical protein
MCHRLDIHEQTNIIMFRNLKRNFLQLTKPLSSSETMAVGGIPPHASVHQRYKMFLLEQDGMHSVQWNFHHQDLLHEALQQVFKNFITLLFIQI